MNIVFYCPLFGFSVVNGSSKLQLPLKRYKLKQWLRPKKM